MRNMTATEYRPEQIIAYKILCKMFPHAHYNFAMELPVPDCKAVLDIAIIPEDSTKPKIAVRVNGAIHERTNRVIKDATQKDLLEAAGWKVFDFWHYDMPDLWRLDALGAEQEIRKVILAT